MGLNLKINRIIFSTCNKTFKKNNFINTSLLKQIAGRAGRSTNDGYVTAFAQRDLEYIRECLGNSVGKGEKPTDFEAPPTLVDDKYNFTETERMIKKACLFPQISDVLEIANKLNKELENVNKSTVTLYDVLLQFDLHSNSDNLYFIKDLKKALKIAEMLRDVESSLENQYNFVMAPCKTKEYCLNYLRKFFVEFNNGLGCVKFPQEFVVDKHKYTNRHISLEEIMLLQNKHNCKI